MYISAITKCCELLLLRQYGNAVTYILRKYFTHSSRQRYIWILHEDNVLALPTFIYDSLLWNRRSYRTKWKINGWRSGSRIPTYSWSSRYPWLQGIKDSVLMNISSSSTILSIHCLAALDLEAGVEQPFNCLIIQNRTINTWTFSSDLTRDWEQLM